MQDRFTDWPSKGLVGTAVTRTSGGSEKEGERREGGREEKEGKREGRRREGGGKEEMRQDEEREREGGKEGEREGGKERTKGRREGARKGGKSVSLISFQSVLWRLWGNFFRCSRNFWINSANYFGAKISLHFF